jgi:predicted GNAT superfamily acetyltransferase
MREKIEIHSLKDIEDMYRAEELQRQVWSGSETDIVPAHIMHAIAQNGGIVLGAFDGEKMVGYVLGFLGTDAKSPDRVAMARLKHCSHQMGVLRSHRNRGVGYRLKLAQREAVVKDGVRLITWTYDPLLSTNAYLNVRRLGCVCQRYLREVYGSLRDDLNVGLPTDRFEVEWWVTSTRVKSRVEETRQLLELKNYLNAGGLTLNPALPRGDGALVPSEEIHDPEGTLLIVEIPSDFQGLKQQDMALAHAWRMQTRAIFERVFSAGYLVTDFIHEKGDPIPKSYYVLAYGEGTFG